MAGRFRVEIYVSFGCGWFENNLSNAARVSSLRRDLNSVTQSVTFDTISRAAIRVALTELGLAAGATTADFFITFTRDLLVITASLLLDLIILFIYFMIPTA